MRKMVAPHIVIGGKLHMERISKWMTGVLLLLVPVQTHWLLRAATWEFGSVRLLVVECGIVMVSLYFVRSWWSQRTARARSAAGCALVLLIVWGVVVSRGSVVALAQIVHMLSAGALGIVLWESLRRWGASWVLSWYVVGGAIWASMGLVQWMQQSVAPSTVLGMAAHAPAIAGDSVVLVDGVRMLRAYGPTPHPNIFGMLMVSYVYAAVLLLRVGMFRKVWSRGAVALVATLCAVALVVSFSRSAWIAATLVLLVAIPWCKAWKKWVKVLIIPVAVVLSVVALVAPGVAGRLQRDNALEARSRDERVGLWHDGVRLVQAHPLLGTGLGLATTGIKQLDPTREGWTLQPPHFTPILLLAELGIVGVSIVAFCSAALPWSSGLIVLVPALIFDHFLWSLPAGLFLLTVLWFLTTIQAKLALDIDEC